MYQGHTQVNRGGPGKWNELCKYQGWRWSWNFQGIPVK